MKIAVCDDDPLFVSDFCSALILALNDVPSVVNSIPPEQASGKVLSEFDLIFLDVELGKISGLEIARQMRAIRKDNLLIFVSSYIEYSPSGYEVQAFRYLLKYEWKQRLPEYLRLAIWEYRYTHGEIVVQCNGREKALELNQLLYIEIDNRKLTFYIKGRNPVISSQRISMQQLAGQLADYGFLRIHKNYLVNMAYIRSLKSTQAELSDETLLPVSTHRGQELRHALMKWRSQNQW